MLRSRIPAPYRAVALVLLLFVFAIRVTVPQGYMWSVTGDNGPAVVLCPDQNPPPVMHMGHGKHHGPHDHKATDHPCGFAAAGAAVDLAALPHTAIAPMASVAVPPAYHRALRPGLGLAAPPPPQTGPPAPI